MGSSFRFKCNQCHLAGDVSGGEDIGFVIRIRTAFCKDCQSLVDVPVEYWSEGTGAEKRDESILHRCPSCESKNVDVWKAGDPCPQCGGEIANTGLVMDWD
jgi:Zn finger protein HypA/HybF involved in hydrogenase expression